jgi:hypothetical protein
MTALPEVRREFGRELRPPVDFDEWEAWTDGTDSHPWSDPEPYRTDPLPELAIHIDLFAGEFFRSNWRRRLADAEGDFGHVARQMRKAGVPLDLALAILLMPDRYVPVLRETVVSVTNDSGNAHSANRVRLKLVR